MWVQEEAGAGGGGRGHQAGARAGNQVVDRHSAASCESCASRAAPGGRSCCSFRALTTGSRWERGRPPPELAVTRPQGPAGMRPWTECRLSRVKGRSEPPPAPPPTSLSHALARGRSWPGPPAAGPFCAQVPGRGPRLSSASFGRKGVTMRWGEGSWGAFPTTGAGSPGRGRRPELRTPRCWPPGSPPAVPGFGGGEPGGPPGGGFWESDITPKSRSRGRIWKPPRPAGRAPGGPAPGARSALSRPGVATSCLCLTGRRVGPAGRRAEGLSAEKCHFSPLPLPPRPSRLGDKQSKQETYFLCAMQNRHRSQSPVTMVTLCFLKWEREKAVAAAFRVLEAPGRRAGGQARWRERAFSAS